jgi:proteasome lid subunit RPN8/RPN11
MSAVRILRQQIPLARSILWAPTSAPRPSDTIFPVFLRQSALQAIYEHMATLPPPGQGILGFLLGDRCECPATGVAYSVIDAALRLNQTIYSDRSLDVVTRLWKRLESQLEAQQAHLIGWYHTHSPLPLEMSAHDVETHKQYFAEPWQVAMVLGTDPETPGGAFFRAGNDAVWADTPQPFYELLNEDSVRPGGKKRSFMTWKTYRAYNPPALQALPGVGARAAAPSPPESTRAEPPPPAPRKSAPSMRPPEPEESVPDLSGREDPSGLENMPQAELEEPGRVDLSEPTASAPPAHARNSEEEEAAWEDPGALKFLSAADDNPPPLPSRPVAFSAPPPLPPSPAPVVDEPSHPGLEDWPEDAPPADDAAAPEAVPEAEDAAAPAPRAARRRGSSGMGRRLARAVGIGLVVMLVGAVGVAAWRFGPSLWQPVWQRVSGFIPHRAPAPAVAVPRPAAAAPAAPVPAATQPPVPQPVAPHPTRVPRPEFALLDQAGDSLALALHAYNGRARLFEKRVLDCPSLGRGMVRVERAAASYGLQRNATRTPLDPAHVDWDHELTAGVDSASRGFQRSQCVRP